MIRMREAPLSIRLAAAALLALLLAVRSLAPAGFMPSFDRGSITIVACPDAAPHAKHHGSKEHKKQHQPCPYASASTLAATGPDWAPPLAVIFFTVALLLGRTFVFVERNAARERPPSRGPPIPV